MARALEHFQRVESLKDPEAIEGRDALAPARTGCGLPSSEVLFVKVRGARRPLAEVTRSAVGRRDDPGEFRSFASDERLGEARDRVPAVSRPVSATTLAENLGLLAGATHSEGLSRELDRKLWPTDRPENERRRH